MKYKFCSHLHTKYIRSILAAAGALLDGERWTGNTGQKVMDAGAIFAGMAAS
jgi:hypothetical protein